MQSTKIICKKCFKFLGMNLQDMPYLVVCKRCRFENIKEAYGVEE